MPKISTHLWFDKEAKEAATFYASIFQELRFQDSQFQDSQFKDSRVKSVSTLHNTPSGSVDLVGLELAGQDFRLISAGPLFKFTPAVSFLVACESRHEVDALWSSLSQGGSALMELGSYPFSEWYGWAQDRYGLSWQVMLMNRPGNQQKIIPTLMFTGKQCGRAEEAIQLYQSLFHNAKIGHIHRYGNEEPGQEGTIKHAGFTLEGQEFAAMDSARAHNFTFNEAISFMVRCETQEEIDHYWQLSADPKAEQCGWLKDKFGISWQVVPTMMDQVLGGKDEKKTARVTQAFLKMKKFDLAKLKEAAEEGASAA